MADEEVVTAPENADVVETPEVAEEVTETEEVETTAEADAESETAEQEAEKPKPDPKIAKAKYEARKLKRENERLMKMLEQQTEAVSRVTQKEVKPPKIEDFETMDDYIEAQFEYRESQKESKTKAAPESPSVDDFSISRDELSANGAEKYEDFEDVVFDETVRITPEMADAIFDIDDSDIQVDVAYFLGQNPKEAARIAKLSERRQIAEIAKLEMKISSKPSAKAKPSKAPAPIKPVGGAKTSTSEIQPTEDFESFLKKRNKQLGR